MIQTVKKAMHQASLYLWSLFLSGLLTILPLTLTLALFSVSFKLITGWLSPIQQYIPTYITKTVPYAEVIIAIGVVFLIGTILKLFVLNTLIHTIERWIIRLPLVRPVYSGIKQLIHAFSIQDKISFKRVVLIEFPRSGIYSVGFLTNELSSEIAPHQNERYFNVFIPTTPNPTTGFFIIVKEAEVTIINLTRQEAMAMIISGGIIQPDRFTHKE